MKDHSAGPQLLPDPGMSCNGERHWKRDLFLIWLSQTLFQLSFSSGIPFVPFFMQSIGVQGAELKFWVAVFGSAPALTTLFFSPFWGMMANRFGCKKMLLRCYLGGAVVLSGIALCTSPHWIIVFRLMQGIVCGSVPVALTLVASLVPKERTGFALGVVNSAIYSGVLFGSFFGGIAADLVGYKNAFLLSGTPCLAAAMIMFFCIRENFTPPKKTVSAVNPLLSQWKKMTLTHWQMLLLMPILSVLGLVMCGRVFDSSFLPLFVQEIHGSLSGAATWTGIIQALSGTAGVLAGLTAGWLSDRFDPGRTALTMAGISMLLLFCLYFTPGMAFLIIMRPLANFAIDSVEPSIQVWLCRKVNQEGRNIALAWAQSIRSAGWFIAPLISGLIVNYFGLRTMYVAAGLIFLIVMLVVMMLCRRDSHHARHRHAAARG